MCDKNVCGHVGIAGLGLWGVPTRLPAADGGGGSPGVHPAALGGGSEGGGGDLTTPRYGESVSHIDCSSSPVLRSLAEESPAAAQPRVTRGPLVKHRVR